MIVYRYLTFLFSAILTYNFYLNNCYSEDFAEKIGGYVFIDNGKEVDNKNTNKNKIKNIAKQRKKNKKLKEKEPKNKEKQYKKQKYQQNRQFVKSNNKTKSIYIGKNNLIYNKTPHNKSINIQNIVKAQKNNTFIEEDNKNNNTKTSRKQKKKFKTYQKIEFLDDKLITDLIDEQEAVFLTQKTIPFRIKNKGVPKICIKNTVQTKKEENNNNKELKNRKDNLKKYIKQTLEENNTSESLIEYIMSNMVFEKQTKIKHNEFIKRTMVDFINRYKIEDRIKNGKLYKKMYQKDFNDIAEIFFVEPNAILTIWSMETNYGSFMGNYNAFKALYSACMNAETMARLNYFYHNIIVLAFLVDKGFFQKDVKSSFDGGLGGCQFMPDSVYRLGVSLRGGKVDIINNNADIFASIANYLHSIGWRYNEGILTEIELPQVGNNGIYPCDIGMNTTKKVSEWKQLGIVPHKNGIGKEYMEDDNAIASLIITDVDDYLFEDNGINNEEAKTKRRAFLVYNNYKVILCYNKHPAYGLTAGLLYEAIGF